MSLFDNAKFYAINENRVYPLKIEGITTREDITRAGLFVPEGIILVSGRRILVTYRTTVELIEPIAVSTNENVKIRRLDVVVGRGGVAIFEGESRESKERFVVCSGTELEDVICGNY